MSRKTKRFKRKLLVPFEWFGIGIALCVIPWLPCRGLFAFCDFLSTAPAFFAAKGKVPIIVAWSRPLRDGRYRCEKVDEISADEARDIWATTQRIATDFERVIRRHPSCWILNYNYFSHIPSEDDLRTLKQREARV